MKNINTPLGDNYNVEVVNSVCDNNIELDNASILRRTYSYGLDLIITLPFYIAFIWIGSQQGIDELILKASYNLIFLIYMIIAWIFFDAQTLGQKIIGVKVVETNSGENIKIQQVFLRIFGYMTCNLMLGIGFLTMFFRKDNRGLHDLISFTSVINVTKEKIEIPNSKNINDKQ